MHRLKPTRSVLDIADRLEAAGFEAWCVGGAIRDSLLGGEPLDWDLATSARPEQVRELFGRKRTIPVGIEFGTVSVLDAHGVPHEVTTFRHDVRTDGRHAEVEFGASLEEDLARRDFTINAIAFRPATQELRDPFGGQRDLDAKLVRAVGDAEQRMREDRLRALRAIRFAARYGFAIEPNTLAALFTSAPFLTRLSAERVQQEIVKTLQQVESPSNAFRQWRSTGALAVLVPSLADVTDLALSTLDCLAPDGDAGRDVPQRTVNRLAALFLDQSPSTVGTALQALRFSKHDIAWCVAMAERWHAVGEEMESALAGGALADVVVRRFLARIGRTHVGGFCRIASARWHAERAVGRLAPTGSAIRGLHRRLMRSRLRDPIEVGDLAIGGDDLRTAGIAPGPIYAKILQSLLERVLERPARNTPQALLADLPDVLASIHASATTSSKH
ncbi:MAG: CCA tRNA nucleotidyltransferase [Gemmatimonadota bacterium]|nr:CCA tRNA nucleotidyltransferase [Gemmatimonadota bacterium]